MCIRLKEAMGVKNILEREEELLQIIFQRLSRMQNVEVLQADVKERLGVISFIVHGAPYNLIVKILNDRFGIQTRGGCSCAGTYGHMLLHVDKPWSDEILKSIRSGDLSRKPGWIRFSIHPTMTNAEVDFIMDAIESTTGNYPEWIEDYSYDRGSNQFSFRGAVTKEERRMRDWFEVASWQ
jgi:selenocysteine lyase/cysteine desulfurase